MVEPQQSVPAATPAPAVDTFAPAEPAPAQDTQDAEGDVEEHIHLGRVLRLFSKMSPHVAARVAAYVAHKHAPKA